VETRSTANSAPCSSRADANTPASAFAAGTDAAEQMIQTLSTFYRRSLAGDPTGDVALDQEIALQRLYLEIEAVRFPERLRTRFDIPAALADARMAARVLERIQA
jgi:LytS/YehU family sensor histidine kinase